MVHEVSDEAGCVFLDDECLLSKYFIGIKKKSRHMAALFYDIKREV
jgi:hypothetical protein